MTPQNTLRSPDYIKVRNVIRSCKHLPHWEVANKCLDNYEARHGKEYGLDQELSEKLNQLK